MDVIRILALAISAQCFVLVIAPPKPAVQKGSTIYRGQLFEFIYRYLAYLGCFLVCGCAFCHSMLLASQGRSSEMQRLVEPLCPAHPHSLDPLSYYSARFVAGMAIVVSGTLIRLASFRTLGSLFTFDVFIKDEHKLVTTGPYAYIRHPSYTGLSMVLLGTHLLHFDSSGWVTHCGVEATPLGVFVYIWRTGTVFTVYSLYRRCEVEDQQLLAQFGIKWEEYRNRVKYALVPYVY